MGEVWEHERTEATMRRDRIERQGRIIKRVAWVGFTFALALAMAAIWTENVKMFYTSLVLLIGVIVVLIVRIIASDNSLEIW